MILTMSGFKRHSLMMTTRAPRPKILRQGGSWGAWLELSFASEKTIGGCRFDATFNGANVSSIHIQVNDATIGWATVYLGSYADHVWVPFAFGNTLNFTTARVRFFSITTQSANFWEIDFWETVALAEVSPGIYVGCGSTGKLLKSTGGAFSVLATMFPAESWVRSIVEANGFIYGGTQIGGRLLAYDGSGWIEAAPQLNSQTIYALALFEGYIYAGTAQLGNLFRYDGLAAFESVAPYIDPEQAIVSLYVFNDKIYGGAGGEVSLFEWNGTDAWIDKAPQLNSQQTIYKMRELEGKLYGVTVPGGRLFEWNGTDAWVERAPQLGSQGNLRSLEVFNGKLYTTGTEGILQEWNGTDAWVEKAPIFTDNGEIFDLVVFEDELYGGKYDLLKWNGTDAWIKVADRETTSKLRTIIVVTGDDGVVPAIFFGTNF